jgi:hypothetical protein
MSFLAYLYQIRENLHRFFRIKKTLSPSKNKSKYHQEVVADKEKSISINCKKAAKEIKYISNFSHWPLAEPKDTIDSLVYLNIRPSKRESNKVMTPAVKDNIIVVEKVVFTRKKIPVKKHP